MKETTSYEITFILKEDQKSDEVTKILTEHEAKITAENDLGSRTLAYEIKKATQGHYFRVVFECSRENIKKIEKDLQKQSAVLRYLIVNALRKPIETERRLPQPTQEPVKTVEPKSETPKEEPKIKEKVVVKPVELPDEEKVEEKKPVEKEGEVVKETKSEVVEPKVKAEKPAKTEAKKPRTIRKATKAEASELDKKLEELVKED